LLQYETVAECLCDCDVISASVFLLLLMWSCVSSYFSQTLHLLEQDESIYCISAWNDMVIDVLCSFCVLSCFTHF